VALRRVNVGGCAGGLDEVRRAANGQQTVSNSLHHCPLMSTDKGGLPAETREKRRSINWAGTDFQSEGRGFESLRARTQLSWFG
jgi:hypothetical protein